MAGTEMLSLRRIGAVSTNAATTAATAGAVQRQTAGSWLGTAGGNAGRGKRSADREGDESAHGFRSIPDERLRSHVRADERCHPVSGRQDHPGHGRNVQPVREADDEREHRHRIDGDAGSNRDVEIAGPEQIGRDARQQRQVDEHGRGREQRRLRPRQPAQQNRQQSHQHVHDLTSCFREAGHDRAYVAVTICRHQASVS